MRPPRFCPPGSGNGTGGGIILLLSPDVNSCRRLVQIAAAQAQGYMTTILLVENDPLQAFVRKSVLEKKFSDVHRVADAAEALCLVEQQPFAANLGLVVSGHHAAGISGPAFVAELHTRMPALPVLVLGNGEETPSEYAGDHVRLLHKPFTTDEILAVAGQMLTQGVRKTA